MTRKTLLLPAAALALLGAFLAACSAPQAIPTPTLEPAQPATSTPTALPPTETPVPSLTPTMTPEPTQPPPEHRIGVRLVDGVGEFYDRLNGERFVPRGNNYIRLADQLAPGGSIFFHSTFNVGSYDPRRSEQELRQMRLDGYNTVRVMLNGCCVANSTGDPAGGISTEYVANLADFLQRAKEQGIYVMLEPGDLPATGGYIELMDTTWSEDFAGNSASYLRTGGVQANIQLWRDLIGELIRQGAPLDAIFAYDLRNEVFFEANLPPLSLTSGVVQTANGQSYDMASDADKQRMMDEGLVYWIDTLRAEILALDPTALVTVGFFWPQEPHPARLGDPRLIDTRAAIWESSADFIDLHLYPGWDLTLAQYVDNFEMAGMQEKPILMGEYGAARASYSREAEAARALHDLQVGSCEYGFDGWLLWTWDTEEQTDFFNALTGEGLINEALSPASRPDPCAAGSFDFFEINLALGATAVASRSLDYQPPSGAVDGTLGQWWGAGAFATQWIQIDLGEPSSVGLIRLVITQSPNGDTLHTLWVGPAADQMTLVHTFDGLTVDGQVLEYQPESPLENVRFVLVITRRSPSWVGWMEIEVMAP